jgi:hypothetical protein
LDQRNGPGVPADMDRAEPGGPGLESYTWKFPLFSVPAKEMAGMHGFVHGELLFWEIFRGYYLCVLLLVRRIPTPSSLRGWEYGCRRDSGASVRDDTWGVEVAIMVFGELRRQRRGVGAWFAHDPLVSTLQRILRVRRRYKEEPLASFASWLGVWRLGELGSLLTLRYL